MKNKINKIIGIVVALAMLSGLVVLSAIPASAGDLSWDQVNVPSATSTSLQITQGTNLNMLQFAPDGKTAFSYDSSNPQATLSSTVAAGVATTSITLTNGAATSVTFQPSGELTLTNGTTGDFDVATYTSMTPASGIVPAGNQATFSGVTWPSGNPVYTDTGTVYGSTLFKSADGGITWTSTNLGANLPAGIIAMSISPNYATDTTLIAATGASGPVPNTLFRSRNGGQSFLAVNTLPIAFGSSGLGNIVSVGIAPYYISTGGTALMVAGTNGIALYDDNDNWRVISDTAQMGGAGISILGATLSPNYQNDGEIVAVVSNVSSTGIAGITLPVAGGKTPSGITGGTVLETKFANTAWNQTVQPSQLLDNNNNAITDNAQGTNMLSASFAFPSDYSSSSSTLNRVYVGINGGTYPDVWRANGTINSSGNVVKATLLGLESAGATGNTVSIAYTGTTASGTLVASESGTNGIWAATTPNSTAAWTQALNAPSGQNAQLVFPSGSSTLYAASANTAVGSVSFGSAIATSTDYSGFKEIALISVPNSGDLSLSNYQFGLGNMDQYLLMQDMTNNVSMIFKSSDDGTTWGEVFNLISTTSPAVNGDIHTLNPSPDYATDNTIYAPQYANTIWKSTDGGNTWNSIAATTPDNSISAFTAIDANNYWLGADSGGIYKSGSYTQIAALDGQVPFAIIPLPFGIVVKTNTSATAGNTSYYLSTDNGVTFNRLGNIGQFSGPFGACTFDVPNNTIYAASSAATNGEIMDWVVGSSTTSWNHVCYVTYPASDSTSTSPITLTAKIGWMNLSGGTMYIQNNDTASDSYQILRCVNITAPEQYITWQGIAGTQPGAANAASNFGNASTLAAASQTVTYNQTGAFNLVYQVINDTTTNGDAQNGYPAMIEKYTDTYVGAPAITSPAADAQTGTSFTVNWNGLPSGSNTATYMVQIATDSGFNNVINTSNNTTNGTSYFVNGATGGNVPLVQGTKYYLRVEATAPYDSPWSAPQAFTVSLGVTGNQNLAGPNGNSMSPGPGATGISVNPTFQWSAITGATGYHIQIADNPGFTSPIADATTTETFFTVSSALNPNTIYYWRVQAVSGTVTSDYVSSVFTTAAAAAPTTAAPAPVQTVQPTIVVTVPPASPAPVSTPGYIWVIIAIGAVLVIAVIVLIARTRRV